MSTTGYELPTNLTTQLSSSAQQQKGRTRNDNIGFGYGTPAQTSAIERDVVCKVIHRIGTGEELQTSKESPDKVPCKKRLFIAVLPRGVDSLRRMQSMRKLGSIRRLISKAPSEINRTVPKAGITDDSCHAPTKASTTMVARRQHMMMLAAR